MIFVDTGVWFSLFVKNDPLHNQTLDWFNAESQPFATSDYIVDETLTLLLKRKEQPKALKFGKSVIEGHAAILTHLSNEQFNRSWILFQQFSRAGLSFTDCTSHIAMQDLGIKTVATFDQHFSATGRFATVP